MATQTGNPWAPRPGSDTNIYSQPGNNYNTGPAPGVINPHNNPVTQSDAAMARDSGIPAPSTETIYDAQGNPYTMTVSYDRYGTPNYGTPVRIASPTSSAPAYNPYGLGGSGGATWYEQQQVKLEQQRLADAEAQQKQAQQLAESQSLDKFNTDFRDFQLKSPYGAQYGPTYFSPAGSVFAQRVPESSILKQAFKDSGQVDPFSVTGNVPAGYTGTTYSNPQHPGLTDFGQPSVQNAQPPEQPQQPMPSGFSSWHDIAHGLPQPQQQGPQAPTQVPTQPVQVAGQPMNLPSFDQGGTVPGASGAPQLIVAHGGETVTPQPSSPDGMNGGGDWQSMFNAWHDALHQGQAAQSGSQSGQPQPFSTANAYGQATGPNMVHGAREDFTSSPLGYNPSSQKYLNNHVQYGPELTGMSGLGGLITPTGTPVVMSEWQKQQFDPTSLSNYSDYAKSIAGWNPADLAQYGTRITGNLGDLSRPTSWAPIGIQPSPSGG